jgi:hypothetical protein
MLKAAASGHCFLVRINLGVERNTSCNFIASKSIYGLFAPKWPAHLSRRKTKNSQKKSICVKSRSINLTVSL